MYALAVHAMPRIAQMRKLVVHALLRSADMHQLPIDTLPGAFPATPVAADPHADTVEPAPGHLGVVIVRGPHQPRGERLSLAHQPRMDRMLVCFIHRPVTPLRDLLWGRAERPKHITDIGVFIIDRFDGGGMRAQEQRRACPKKRLDIVWTVPQGLPNKGSRQGLPPRPGEQGLEGWRSCRRHGHLAAPLRQDLNHRWEIGGAVGCGMDPCRPPQGVQPAPLRGFRVLAFTLELPGVEWPRNVRVYDEAIGHAWRTALTFESMPIEHA